MGKDSGVLITCIFKMDISIHFCKNFFFNINERNTNTVLEFIIFISGNMIIFLFFFFQHFTQRHYMHCISDITMLLSHQLSL